MLNTLINQGYIVEDNKISFLQHPQQYLNSLLELIKNARQRILINCLYLENDQSGQLVMQALINAVEKNPQLQVDVFLDLHRAQRSRLGEEQKLSNSHWYYQTLSNFNRKSEHGRINIYGVPCNARELFGVYHIKGMVFDNTILYTGASINNNYCAYQTYRQDRYQLIEDQALANAFYDFIYKNFATAQEHALAGAKAAISLFSDNLSSRPGKSERLDYKNFRQNVLCGRNLKYAKTSNDGKANNLVPGHVIITPLFGIGKRNPINQTIFEVITQAQEQILIYTPYFNFTKQLTKRLIEACKRGVKLRIILSDKVANDFYTDPEDQSYTSANSLPYLYELNLRKFLKNNQNLISEGKIEVFAWRHDNNSYHAKGLAIDNKFYIWTGSNLNERSFNIDAENALLVYDPYYLLKQRAEHEMQFMLQHCTKLTSYQQIEAQRDYPRRVKQTLRRARWFFIDKLAKKLF